MNSNMVDKLFGVLSISNVLLLWRIQHLFWELQNISAEMQCSTINQTKNGIIASMGVVMGQSK